MRLRDMFLASVHGLFAFATLLLAVGETSWFPHVLGVPLILVSWWVMDRHGRWRTPGWGLNAAAAVGIMMAATEFFGGAVDARLTGAAHLLVYLGWVVLLSRKADRHYWWMMALSVLQVSVGAVLVEPEREALFSFLVVVYMLGATWTLSVFSLFQVQGRFASVPSTIPVPPGPAWLRPTAAGVGWQLDANEQWVNLRFVAGVSAAGVGALCIASLFFMLIPRLWLFDPGDLDDADNSPLRPLTGFTETVELGEIREILESTDHVMSVEVVDRATGERQSVNEVARNWGDREPMFRGTVMVAYSGGKWERGLPNARFDHLSGTPSHQEGWRQDIQLETMGSRVLFGMHPVEGCVIDSVDRYATFHPATGVILGTRNRDHRRVTRYSLFSPNMVPATVGQSRVPAVMSQAHRAEYLGLPSVGLDRLVRRARGLTASVAGSGPVADRRRAELLLAHLASDRFRYSLEAAEIPAGVDPVEDFLFDRQRGHCEYFASALALMLRATGVPSRLVSGFQGGTLNQLTGQFMVQQRHAHAWVEAWIGGRWVTLDPTPATRGEMLRGMQRDRGLLRDAGDVVERGWRRYVVELSLAQQQTLFYDPLKSRLEDAMAVAGEVFNDALSAATGLASGRGVGEDWPALLLMTVPVLLMAACAWGVARWRAGWRPGRLARQVRSGGSGVHVLLYERFCGLLAAQGQVRRPTQTALEFAASVQQREAEDVPDGVQLGELAARVSAGYCSERFGGVAMEEAERVWIASQLDAWERGRSSRRHGD